MIISHPKGKSLRLYKKLKGMLWWNDFTKDGNQTIEKNLEVKGNTVLNPKVGIGTNNPAQMVHIEHPSLDSVVRIGATSNKTSAMQFYSHADAYTWQMGVPYNADRFVIDESSISAGDDLVVQTGGKVGVGTQIIPHGGIGYAKFAIDDYPVFQQLNWGHDNISLNFDAYYDGAWKSSDAGSSFQIYKIGNELKINYDTIAAGSGVPWHVGIIMDTSGMVGIPTINASHKLNVTGTAGLSTGTAWTNTSDVRIKTNVETVTGGIDKINQLRPVSFNYTSDYLEIHPEIDGSKKYNSFIANEYAEVFPDAVSVCGNLERITPSSNMGEPDDVEVLIEDLLQYTPHDLHVYLVKAVQELSAKVTTLENN
jgi:hypothetical protein